MIIFHVMFFREDESKGVPKKSDEFLGYQFSGESKQNYNEKLLNDRPNDMLNQLIKEIDAFKREAEKMIQLLEKVAEERIKELEVKLTVLEERVWLLNQVLVSMNPDKRIN